LRILVSENPVFRDYRSAGYFREADFPLLIVPDERVGDDGVVERLNA